MRRIHYFIGRWGEHKFWDFYDRVKEGYTDDWISQHVFNGELVRQHVGKYRRIFFREVLVLSEIAEAALADFIQEREKFEDRSSQRLNETRVIRVQLDESKRLRKTSSDSK